MNQKRYEKTIPNAFYYATKRAEMRESTIRLLAKFDFDEDSKSKFKPISKLFYDLVHELANDHCDGSELDATLCKLLEARDWAWRAIK